MITAVRTPGGLTIRGHAGYAAPGQDIVCAAVSILAETLASTLPSGAVRMGNGTANFRCSPSEMDFAWRGLSLLAHQYPENIALVKKCP